MIFDTLSLQNKENYALLTGGVTPRAIAWISTRSKKNVDNLAPYSFFTVASCNPPVLLYTQVTQQSGLNKDTLRNLIETGECVVNIVNTSLLEKMNQTSATLSIHESEFDFASVETCPSHAVTVKSVKESPVRYECTLRDVIPICSPASEAPPGGSVILLDVKSVYVRDDMYQNGKINQQLIDSVGKMGGDRFSLTSESVEISRPIVT